MAEDTRPGLSAFVNLLGRRPGFRRLWINEVISYLGDWLSYIAVSLISMQKGEGAIALALVLVAHSLPHALLAPVAGPLADRLDRRTLMLMAHGVRAALTLLMAWAAFAEEVSLVQLLLLLRVSVGAFYLPAARASYPRFVEKHELYTANALSGLTWSVMFTSGVALGGLVAECFGPVGAILLDALTFVAAAGALWGLPSIKAEAAPADSAGLMRRAWREMSEAMVFASRHRRVARAVSAKAPLALLGGAGWIALNYRAEAVTWAAGGAALGLFHAIRGFGTGVGPLVSVRVRWLSAPWVIYSLTLASMALFAVAYHPVWLALSLFVWGAGTGANWVAASAELQQVGPDRLLGRLSALDMLLVTVNSSASVLLAGVMVDAGWAPPQAAWLGVALGTVGWAVVSGATRWAGSREAAGAEAATPVR